jgi:transposase
VTLESEVASFMFEPMRGKDTKQSAMFSYVSAERRVPADHPLRPIRAMVDVALKGLSRSFARMYPDWGRPSIAPEKLLRALLLQLLYSIRSERMLMEQLEYNLLFRWFVGLNIDEPVWVPTVFSKNRDRLLEGDIAAKFFAQVLAQARGNDLLSDEQRQHADRYFAANLRRRLRGRNAGRRAFAHAPRPHGKQLPDGLSAPKPQKVKRGEWPSGARLPHESGGYILPAIMP